MTNITELAQSLKAAADREMICRDVAETSEIWERTVTPENILALVEALEKAQSKNALVAGGIEATAKLHERIAELDAELEREREKTRRVMSRIAELESRTVKLPTERFCPAEYAGSQLWSETEVWNKAITACADALRAAGIKVEAE